MICTAHGLNEHEIATTLIFRLVFYLHSHSFYVLYIPKPEKIWYFLASPVKALRMVDTAYHIW